MKNKLLIALLAIVISPIFGYAQFRTSCHLQGTILEREMPIYGGELKIQGAETYGINIDYNLDRDNAIQFSYTYASRQNFNQRLLLPRRRYF